ncbi:hypothetical protein GGD68_002472 [Paraburkholderia fungorum]|uniref:Uncharacterized protein n=1 Tax=Paraburkholderia fungorum TaxID=134537 RepID=A0AAW3UTN5_9BURK|nr:hypothetical protein [Paraburkholderia fungorum]MBB6200952.1 hypothetical protein [Paraburkholderia fungorum]
MAIRPRQWSNPIDLMDRACLSHLNFEIDEISRYFSTVRVNQCDKLFGRNSDTPFPLAAGLANI